MVYARRRASSYKSSKRTRNNADGDGGIGFVPRNELNVREVFAQRAARLGYRIVESRTAYPDYVLGQGRARLLAEAEYRTSDFLRHRHDMARCDLIVVWEHDLPYMPVPVLELKTGETHRPKRGRPPRFLGHRGARAAP
jgi:hypothetical protein